MLYINSYSIYTPTGRVELLSSYNLLENWIEREELLKVIKPVSGRAKI